MFQRNVELEPYKKNSAWRKIALGTWRRSGDPSVYGWVDFDARPLIKKIQELKEDGVKITPTAVAAKAAAVAIASYPRLNGIIRFGRIYYRKNVDVFLQVTPDMEGDNLSGIVIRDCDKKSLEEIAAEIKEKGLSVKRDQDKDYKKIKNTMNLIPGFIMGKLLDTLSFILYNLNLWSPLLGPPKDSFGSIMVTSVGPLGLDRGFAPLVPYSRVPALLAIGQIKDQVTAVDGKAEVIPMIPFCATLDHRLIDGVGASKMLRALKKYMKDPY